MIICPFTEKDLPKHLLFSEYKNEIDMFNDDCIKINVLINKIDNKLVHRCSIQSFRSILKDRFINPNKGQYQLTYPQSETYIGGQNQWICLFDFTIPPFYIMYVHDVWMPFLTDQKPYTVLLLLNISKLENIIDNPFCGNNRLNSKSCIPYLEIWHKAPINISMIQEVAFVPSQRPNEFISCSLELAQKYLEGMGGW